MQRAVFLIEATGERLTALVNPERLDFTRRSGIRPLRHAGGVVTGNDLSDDPLVTTGGGATELTLDLLFDVDLIEGLGNGAGPGAAAPPPADGAPPPTERERVELGLAVPVNTARLDVRKLTRPFWDLAENIGSEGRRGAPPLIRFIWGRSWNVLGYILAVAERFERMDEEGRPKRSFMRLRLRRANEPLAPAAPDVGLGPARSGSITPFYDLPRQPGLVTGESGTSIEVQVDGDGAPGPRIEQFAVAAGGVPADWRKVAVRSGIDDPLHLPPGTILTYPGRPGDRP